MSEPACISRWSAHDVPEFSARHDAHTVRRAPQSPDWVFRSSRPLKHPGCVAEIRVALVDDYEIVLQGLTRAPAAYVAEISVVELDVKVKLLRARSTSPFWTRMAKRLVLGDRVQESGRRPFLWRYRRVQLLLRRDDRERRHRRGARWFTRTLRPAHETSKASEPPLKVSRVTLSQPVTARPDKMPPSLRWPGRERQSYAT